MTERNSHEPTEGHEAEREDQRGPVADACRDGLAGPPLHGSLEDAALADAGALLDRAVGIDDRGEPRRRRLQGPTGRW